MNLLKASYQWFNRPDDERWNNLHQMHRACLDYREKSTSEYFHTSKLKVYAGEDSKTGKTELLLNIDDEPTKMTHYGFNQLCSLAQAPSDYIRFLGNKDPELAVTCLNKGIAVLEHREAQGLIYRPYEDNYGKLCRSIMTPSYRRIWNSDITGRLLGLLDTGWRVPPARPAFPGQSGIRQATEDDVLGDASFSLSVKVGDWIADAGLYASDHDCFIFMVNPQVYIEDNGTPLYRGFFIWNSEVGASVLGILTFLYRHVCGNHIVWGASGVKKLKIKHIGAAQEIFSREFDSRLVDYTNSATYPDVKFIETAKAMKLGIDKDDVINTILSTKKKIVIPKTTISDAYVIGEMNEQEDGAPNTVWGMTNALTRLSQDNRYMDQRVKLDEAAGKILQLAA